MMRRRRGRGEGSITHREAVDLLRRLGGRAVEGQLLTTSTPTVAVYLEDSYATNMDAWRPSTRQSYRRAIDGYKEGKG